MSDLDAMSDPPAMSDLPRDLPTWSDAAAREAVAGLPDPPKDEPAALRDDIHDELADHLACAFRRELLRGGGDVQRAHRAVLDRFGDPAAVARTLWFQAMQGKLMAQKLLITVLCLAAAAAVGSTVVVWQLVQTNQTATAALLADSRTAQAALLERLAAAENRPAWSANPEWNPIVLRFCTRTRRGNRRPRTFLLRFAARIEIPANSYSITASGGPTRRAFSTWLWDRLGNITLP